MWQFGSSLQIIEMFFLSDELFIWSLFYNLSFVEHMDAGGIEDCLYSVGYD